MLNNLSESEVLLFELISQMLDVLEACLPRFAVQAAEQVFKAHPEISTQFEKQQVKSLQQDVQQAAQAATQKIIGELANEELWLMDNVRKVRESLHHNPKVWQVLQGISPVIDALLQKYGYPPQLGPEGHFFSQTQLKQADQLPDNEQLKVLTIKYWSALIRQRQQRADQLRQEQAVYHRKLDEMWHH